MKRKPQTPKSQIKSAIRKIFLRSRERAAQLKRDGYSCQCCGAKQSRAMGREIYVEVHHRDGIDWNGVIDLIIERVLNQPMVTLCKECHAAEHRRDEDA